MTEVIVRPATAEDGPAVNAIYNEFIVDSHVSFDESPWSDDDRTAWLESRIADGYPVFVAAAGDDDVVTGH